MEQLQNYLRGHLTVTIIVVPISRRLATILWRNRTKKPTICATKAVDVPDKYSW